MPVSSVQSGYQLLQQSQSMSEAAAEQIAESATESNLEFNKINTENRPELTKESKEKPTLEDALTKLNQSHTYSQIGANVVQRSNDAIGTMLDTQI